MKNTQKIATIKAQGLNPSPEETVEVSDLRMALEKLQTELAKAATVPTTAAEVVAYDEGLQRLAKEMAPRVVEVEAFLRALEARPALKEEPLFSTQMNKAVGFLADIEQKPALAEYVKQTKLFLALKTVKSRFQLREKLEELLSLNLVFKARRDPKLVLPEKAVLFRENDEEVFYNSNHCSLLSQLMWEEVTGTCQRLQEELAERREVTLAALAPFRRKATLGLTPLKAVKEVTKGLLFLSALFTDQKTGGRRPARMLLAVGRGNFTVEETFPSDRVEFILRQARDREDRYRWFPLDPAKFNPAKAPPAIAEIVWPALWAWYDDEVLAGRSQEIQARSEISPADLLAGKPGFCGIFVEEARTSQRGPDDLTLALRGTGQGTLILEEYLSRKGIFDFQALVGQEFPLQKEKLELYQKIGEGETLHSIQARIIRGFLCLAGDCQHSAEILAKRGVLKPQVTVAEGLEEKVGHSVFHVPRAYTYSRGPAHLTCHMEWQREGFILREYVSWVEPWEESKGRLELNETVGVLIPRQPVEGEKPVIQVIRHLIRQRKEYEAWKTNQVLAKEENNT